MNQFQILSAIASWRRPAGALSAPTGPVGFFGLIGPVFCAVASLRNLEDDALVDISHPERRRARVVGYAVVSVAYVGRIGN